MKIIQHVSANSYIIPQLQNNANLMNFKIITLYIFCNSFVIVSLVWLSNPYQNALKHI